MTSFSPSVAVSVLFLAFQSPTRKWSLHGCDSSLPLRSFFFHAFATGCTSQALLHLAKSLVLAYFPTLSVTSLLRGTHLVDRSLLVGTACFLQICRSIRSNGLLCRSENLIKDSDDSDDQEIIRGQSDDLLLSLGSR